MLTRILLVGFLVLWRAAAPVGLGLLAAAGLLGACSAGETAPIAPAERGNLFATIQALDGKPIADALMLVRSTTAKDPVPDLAPISNTKGELRWGGLPVGTYTMEVAARGYAKSEQTIEIVAGKTASATYKLKPAD
ncbi:MAG: carboxypeptidase regulatory-like domain-containing protein [Fimbriimonas ginsengisoli]|uniref:Carboxypeptidase regulatory-like domain-containing protein n=1 Tax=Fimbriimonas ginsengisoli TaxID=1005039 RepID=A0A931LTF4_FIMGI|nr:carboxypeptidase regulatory-like domain-containing protein [Fimbriimonas ginsengisoli]